jgi:hypothetical protein
MGSPKAAQFCLSSACLKTEADLRTILLWVAHHKWRSRTDDAEALRPGVLARVADLVRVLVGAVASNRTPKLALPPGTRLNAVAEFLFSKKTYERVFQPTISDLQDEYIAALALDRSWKARWVWIRGHLAFWKAFALQVPISLMRAAMAIWQAAG